MIGHDARMIPPRIEGVRRSLAWLLGAAMFMQGGCDSDKPEVATQQVTEIYNGKLIPVNEPVEETDNGSTPLQADGGTVRLLPGDGANYARVQNGGAVPFNGYYGKSSSFATNLLSAQDAQK
jgi:hypothetical protein